MARGNKFCAFYEKTLIRRRKFCFIKEQNERERESRARIVVSRPTDGDYSICEGEHTDNGAFPHFLPPSHRGERGKETLLNFLFLGFYFHFVGGGRGEEENNFPLVLQPIVMFV